MGFGRRLEFLDKRSSGLPVSSFRIERFVYRALASEWALPVVWHMPGCVASVGGRRVRPFGYMMGTQTFSRFRA